MKYNRYIRFNRWARSPLTWFTIMGGIASALMYIQHNQTTCINKRS